MSIAGRPGLRVGAAASVRQLELFGDIHIHSPIPPLGAAGIQCGAPQLACGRLDGHASRFASAALWDADLQLSVFKLVYACCSHMQKPWLQSCAITFGVLHDEQHGLHCSTGYEACYRLPRWSGG